MRQMTCILGALALVGIATACSDNNEPDTIGPIGTAVSAAGDITAKVDEFRALLGEPRNGGNAGPQTAGRREINWDGVPAQFDNGDNLFPSDFFNTTVKLGAIFATNGTGFRNDSTLFTGVNTAYGEQFNVFSANKIFSAVGSNIIDVTFRVAGTTTPALVSGFGSVFSDVDAPNASSLEYFAQDGRSLGRYEVPTRSDAVGLSFLGVKFDSIAVARVRITAGQGAMGTGINDVSAGGTIDLAVVDDFLYSEPQPAP